MRRMRQGERGQAIILMLLVLSVFLVASATLAVDLTNLYLHRQAAQGAADAACGAGAEDMLAIAKGAVAGTSPAGFNPHFTPGTAITCKTTQPNTATTSPTPCWYASINGYNSVGLVASSPSNEVMLSFPTTAGGICPAGATCPAPGVTPPPIGLLPVAWQNQPFLRIDVVDRVKVFFIGLLNGSQVQDVRAFAMCGVILPNGALPIGGFNPHGNTNSDSPGGASLDMDNNATLAVVGGPTLGIAINNSTGNAINLSGTSTIDLSKGGPNQTGSSIAVTGSINNGQGCGTPGILLGTTGHCITPAPPPIGDPYALTAAPIAPGSNAPAPTTTTALAPNGCPLPLGVGCKEYVAGKYPAGINIPSGTTAIFDPGVYFITGGMTVPGVNTCVRPSTRTGDGSGGTMFYFSDNNSISVSMTTSGLGPCGGTAYCSGSACTSLLNCPGNSSALPPGLPAINGNVFLAPCTGTYGDPLAALPGGDPAGTQRGIVFFQNRNQTPTINANCSQGLIPCPGPALGGSAATLTVGTLYFHQCKTTGGVDTGGTGCSASAYNTTIYFSGSSTTNNAGVGNVMADNIRVTQTAKITMNLTNVAYNAVLKASMLR